MLRQNETAPKNIGKDYAATKVSEGMCKRLTIRGLGDPKTGEVVDLANIRLKIVNNCFKARISSQYEPGC